MDGQQVTDAQIQISVESSAPYVLIAWEKELGTPAAVPVAPYGPGYAYQTLATSGYAGPMTIIARECTSETVCEGPQSSITVDVVSSPVGFHDREPWLDELHGSATFAADGGTARKYGWFLDGEFVAPMSNWPTFELNPQALDLADGVHTLQVAACTVLSYELALDPPVCDMANASEVRTFTLRTALHPTITRVGRSTISPNGDGFADTVRVTVDLEAPQRVQWLLVPTDGTRGAVDGSGPVLRQPGPFTFTVDGIDEYGQRLPSGTYSLEMVSTSHPSAAGVDERMIFGFASTTLKVDNDAPEVTDVSATPEVFHPPVDGDRDTVQISGRLSEHASRFRVRLLRQGTVVRRLWLGPHPAGPIAATWDGRGPRGTLLRPGTYDYEFVTRDRVGNKVVRPGGTVESRWKR